MFLTSPIPSTLQRIQENVEQSSLRKQEPRRGQISTIGSFVNSSGHSWKGRRPSPTIKTSPGGRKIYLWKRKLSLKKPETEKFLHQGKVVRLKMLTQMMID